MVFVRSRFFFPLLLFLGFLALYIHNLSNSVYGGDVGDLITAAYVHGVPHAPGYPLFTFIGYLLTRVIPWYSPAWRVGLISALSGACGILFFYLLLKRLTKNVTASFLTTLILGLCFFYWFYAEIAEVFALHIFFVILLLYISVLFRETKKYFFGILLFFLLGLSCTNHQTIILLFPSLLLIIFPAIKKVWLDNKKKILGLFVASIFGFFPYIYVPLASSTHPPLNWDNVHDFQTFLHLFLRVDYGTFQSGVFNQPSFFQKLVSLQVYGQYLLTQLTIPVCCLSLIGLWYVWTEKKQRIYLYALSLAFLLSGPVFIYYAGFSIDSSFGLGVYERFFLMSGVVLLIFFPFGLVFLTKKLASFFPKKPYATLFQSIFLIIPLALLAYNFSKTDLATTQMGDNYAKDILTTLPSRAVLVAKGDTLVFNMWYVHYALHVRPDVDIYNIGGGTTDSSINTNASKGKSTQDEIVRTFKEVNQYRPVYSTFEFQSQKDKKITWIPYGLSYQLVPDNQTIPSVDTYRQTQNDMWKSLHVPSMNDLSKKVNHSLTIAQIPEAYSNAMLAIGSFFYTKYQDKKDTLLYYNKAIQVAPDNASAYLARGVYFLGEENNCRNVISNFSTSLQLDQFQKPTYFLLYSAYKNCTKNSQVLTAIKKAFTVTFQQDFDKQSKTVLTDLTL